MKLVRVAILCNNVRHFKEWVKINELKLGTNKHFAMDVANFVEYTAFFINEPMHRAEDKFRSIYFHSIGDISLPEMHELENYNKIMKVLHQRVRI